MNQGGRRAEILKVSRALFREKGYHATTIRDIAEQSGLLSGSLYAHIRTKEDLLFEITDTIADQFIGGLEAVLQTDADPVTKFRAALAAHIGTVGQHIDAATVFSQEWRALSDERREQIQAKRDRYEQLWQQLLAEGVQKGEFRAEGGRFSRIVILSVANWLYQWYDPAGPLDPPAVADRLADVLLLGLRVGGE